MKTCKFILFKVPLDITTCTVLNLPKIIFEQLVLFALLVFLEYGTLLGQLVLFQQSVFLNTWHFLNSWYPLLVISLAILQRGFETVAIFSLLIYFDLHDSSIFHEMKEKYVICHCHGKIFLIVLVMKFVLVFYKQNMAHIHGKTTNRSILK